MIKAFGYAMDGWKWALRERNIKIHLLMSLCVISMSIFFQISLIEWIIVLFLIGAVISVEIINTAVEDVCNILKTKLKLQYNETMVARDLAAGAVLWISVVSALIGLIIFTPKVLMLLV